MCGIAGFLSREPLPASLLEEMTSCLSHRGPDGTGYFGRDESGNIHHWQKTSQSRRLIDLGLGHRRLSIIDLTDGGAQPMISPDGRYSLVFNGEIYNYIELREEWGLTNFRSQSDTEVLLYGLTHGGPQSLLRFNGIFSFALFDVETGELLLARDPFGVKPMYYVASERGFFFASEIKALLKTSISRPTLRLPLLSRFLMTNWIPDPDTLFEGIHKLEPGHLISIGSQFKVRKRSFWDMNFEPVEEISESQVLDRLEATLSSALKRQLRSDVPVGFFLSGGVDSSLLVAKSLELNRNRLKSFTIGFKWSPSREDHLDLSNARVMKQKFNLDHEEIILEPSILSLLPKVVQVLEEPIVDPAAICSYLICEAASSQYKVMISGQGADELFGGYPVYQAGLVAYGLQHLPSFLVSMFDVTSEMLPYSIQGYRLQNVHRLKKLIFSLRHSWPEPFFLLRGALRSDQVMDLLTTDVLGAQVSPFSRHMDHFGKARQWDALHQMMYIDTKTYLPNLNLSYTDKTSMKHSIEVRVPYLDLEIASLVASLPSRNKANLNESKILLKSLAEKTLPRDVVRRKKMGFGLPLKDWLLGDLQPMVSDLLSSDRLRRQGLLDPFVVQTWLREHRERVADHSMKLFSLMTFQLWCDEFSVSV